MRSAESISQSPREIQIINRKNVAGNLSFQMEGRAECGMRGAEWNRSSRRVAETQREGDRIRFLPVIARSAATRQSRSLKSEIGKIFSHWGTETRSREALHQQSPPDVPSICLISVPLWLREKQNFRNESPAFDSFSAVPRLCVRLMYKTLDALAESNATLWFGHVASELFGSRNPFIDH